MAKNREYAPLRTDMQNDEDWRDLTPPAQHLYYNLTHAPSCTRAGVVDWRPVRIASSARGWTPAAVNSAAAELAEKLFIVIDESTEEVLIRSFIKHDKTVANPKSAVTMANDYAEVASKLLRGVIVHELQKLHRNQPTLAGWKQEVVAKMLTRTPIDPATYPTGYPRPGIAQGVEAWSDPTPFTPRVAPGFPQGLGEGLHEGLGEGFTQTLGEGLHEGFPQGFPSNLNTPKEVNTSKEVFMHADALADPGIEDAVIADPAPSATPEPAESAPAPAVIVDPEPAPAPAKAKRGTRITEDYRPSATVYAAMAEQFPDVDLDAETEQFIDYWLAIPGQRGTKLNWDATWRNRIRDQHKYKTERDQRFSKPRKSIREEQFDRAAQDFNAARAQELGLTNPNDPLALIDPWANGQLELGA